MFELAQGGTLLTGIGGDELWGSSRAPQFRLRRRALRLAPFAVRRAVLARKQQIDFPWLREHAAAQVRRAAAGEAAAAPWTVRGRMAYTRGMRYVAVATAALERLAADAGAAVVNPLLDLDLWAAVAAAAPRGGFTTRDAALALVAGQRLPAELVARRTKAGFDAVFFNEHARALARDWDGNGVDAELVDAAALRAHWLGETTPDPHSLTLLQALWLRSAGDRVEEPVGRLGQ
jgi:asparagine synthase (glutamine-hydrolysing)